MNGISALVKTIPQSSLARHTMRKACEPEEGPHLTMWALQ